LKVIEDVALYDNLYEFFSNAIPTTTGVTILAVEEPESHLHPIYQRLLYRHIMSKTNTSVIVTTHSPYISSVAPLTSIVHLIVKNSETIIKTTAGLKISDKDKSDLSRYIDVKRGEIYTAKGVIFVEGVTEEYLFPSFAKIKGFELDRLGVVVCNIDSTNFKPYCQFADALDIPYVVITDGDYYYENDDKAKCFGELERDEHQGKGFYGLDRAYAMLEEKINTEYVNLDLRERRLLFTDFNVYVGENTIEVDIFKKASEEDKTIICDVFNQLTHGGKEQKENFSTELATGDYIKCLDKIEASYSQIGKGRFAQRLADNVTGSMIPEYIDKAIDSIAQKVR